MEKLDKVGELNKRLPSEYKLLRQIGTGGNRDVYLAEVNKSGLEYKCVIKLKKAEGERKEYIGEDPREEARILMNIRHQNIENLYDFGVFDDGRFWVATEFIDGKNLDEIINERGKSLSLLACLHLFSQVADAVSFFYTNGLVHRDLTLRNIIMTNRTSPVWYKSGTLTFKTRSIKVVDFQLIKKSSHVDFSDKPWSSHYIPPAYFRGEKLTSAYDLDAYAFGVCLYRALTGKYLVDFTNDKIDDVIDYWKSMDLNKISSFFSGEISHNIKHADWNIVENKRGIYEEYRSRKSHDPDGAILYLINKGEELGSGRLYGFGNEVGDFIENLLDRGIDGRFAFRDDWQDISSAFRRYICEIALEKRRAKMKVRLG